MQTIIVRYFSTVVDPATGSPFSTLLGTERFEGIREALIPGVPAAGRGKQPHPVFITKCFSSSKNHRWELKSVTSTPASANHPAVFSVLLQAQDVSKEVFLYQTLKKDKNQTPWKILRPGTLVEVDYGFVQRTGRSDASMKTNKRYSDTVLAGEMHKRRLAVVVKVISSNLVQVAPVTSVLPPPGDKSIFKLDQATLDKMPRYQLSGKPSFVLCARLESVSVQRLLPPLSYNSKGSSRNVRYATALTRAQEKLLKAAMLHGIGASNFVPHNDLLQQQRRADQLEEVVARLTLDLATCRAELRSCAAVESLAKRWACEMGLNYDEELSFQYELDEHTTE